MSEQALAASPYKGLTPYSEDDASFFFGRQRERDMIEANLIATRLTLLYGASGVGKSSVLRAGVVHHLRAEARQRLLLDEPLEHIVVVANAWRDDPLHSLLDAVHRTLLEVAGAPGAETLALLSPSAAAFTPTLQAWTGALDCDLLVILDQFEEYLFYHPNEDGLGTLAFELPRAINHPDLRVNFLIAIREDALARLDRFKGRIPSLFANYLRIQHLDVAAARAAIEQPLAAYNDLYAPPQPVGIEPTLVEEVLAQVQTNQVFVGEMGRGVTAASGPLRVETPYLQLVMSRLWAEEIQAGQTVLRLATLQQLGGAERIVRTHLDTVLATLTPAEQQCAARVFHHLVTPSGAKIAHSVPDLAEYSGLTPDQLTPVLEKLSSFTMRILRPVAPPPDQPAAAARFEIFHDVLSAPILDWRLRFAHAQEQAAAEARLLAERAEAVERLRRQETEAAARLAQERRRTQRLALGALGLLALLLVMAALVVAFDQQVNIARRATARANAAAARNLAVSANLQLASDPELSVLLAMQAAQVEPIVQAEDALRQALVASPVRSLLRDHAGPVSVAAFSPDGAWLATAGFDGQIALREARTGRLIALLPDHAQSVFCLAFSPDSRLLVSGGRGAIARLWTVPDGALQTEIPNLGGEIYRCVFGPTDAAGDFQLLLAGGGFSAFVWDVRSQQMALFLEGHRGGLWFADFSPDGQRIVTTSADRTARIWDAVSGRPLAVLSGHEDDTLFAVFDASGRWVATASRDRTARLWDATTGEQVRVFLGHTAEVNGLTFDAAARRLYGSSLDGRVLVWDVASGAIQAELRHDARITGLMLSPDGRLLLTSSADHTAALWNTHTWQRLQTLRGHTDAVSSGLFHPGGALVVTTSLDGAVRLWTANAGQSLYALPAAMTAQPIWSAAFSPDGARIVSAGDDGSVILWDALSGQQLAASRGHTGAVYRARFSPDGQRLVSVGADGDVRWWSIADGAELAVWRGHTGPINDVVFDADGKRLLTVSNDQTALVWDAASGQPVLTLRSAQGVAPPNSANEGSPPNSGGREASAQGALLRGRFDHKGARIVVIGVNGRATLWDARTGAALVTLSHCADGAEAGAACPLLFDAEFSPDDRLLVTAGADGSARLWDVASGQPLLTPLPHDAPVTRALFSPDGASLLTISQDKTAVLWDVASGQRLLRLADQQAPLSAVALSPNGHFVAIGGDTGDPTVRLWDLRTGQMLRTYWGHVAGVLDLDFDAGGRFVVSAGKDGAVQVYDCDICGDLPALMALAPDHVTRELTAEERRTYLYELQAGR